MIVLDETAGPRVRADPRSRPVCPAHRGSLVSRVRPRQRDAV